MTRGDNGSRRRILLVIKCLGYGGAERLLVDMVATRNREDFDYEVAYVLSAEHALGPGIRAEGVPLHDLGATGNGDLRWLRRFRTLLVEGRFDVVHFHLPYAAALGRLVVASLPRANRPVVVTTEHSLWDKMAVLLRVLNRVTAPRDQALLVVSQPAYDALPPALQRRAQVMVHGVDLARSRDLVARRDVLRQEVRAELDVPDGDLLALTVANLRTEKGYDVLLDAARLAADRGDRIRFAAVGRGPLKEELEARHRALGLGEQFRFLGQRDDALRLLAGADVFVLTSHHEGLPVALMEAMSVGRATVATAVGGVAHVLTDGEDALVVPPRRPDAVVDALERLQADPALREVLGRGALARGADFDIAATTARVEDVYRRLVPVPGGVAPSPVPPTGSVSPPAR